MIESSNVPPSPLSRITPQLVVGLLITFIGVVFSLDELGIAPAGSYLRFWPTALVVVGVLKLLQAKEGGGAFAGLLFTLAGVWLQAEEFDIIHVRLWQIWPLALVLFGGYLVWQGLVGREPQRQVPQPAVPRPDGSPRATEWGTPCTQTSDPPSTVIGLAILCRMSRGNNSRAFPGPGLLAIMGGYQL